MADYATVTDVMNLKRSLTSDEQSRASQLITIISALIRSKGKEVGKNVDLMIEQDPDYAEVVKGVVCDAVMREINTPGTMLPATSYSESAGSVSQSYSLPNASGSIKLWPSDLKTLGFKRQQIGALDLMSPRGC